LREENRLRVFENRVLRRIFGPKRDEVTGEWRKLHNEELVGLYSSTNMLWVIKSTIMRWAGLVARMGKRRSVHRILVGKPDGKIPFERYHLGDTGADEMIILRWIFWKWDVGVWTGSSWLRIGRGGEHL